MPVGATVGVLVLLEMALVLLGGSVGAGAGAGRRAPGYATPRRSGALLYVDYVYPFEIAAVILLVAIVAAIALTIARARKRTPGPSNRSGCAQGSRAAHEDAVGKTDG